MFSISFGLIEPPELVIKPSTTYKGPFELLMEFPPLITTFGVVPGA